MESTLDASDKRRDGEGEAREAFTFRVPSTVTDKAHGEVFATRQPFRPPLHFHVICLSTLVTYFHARTFLVYALASKHSQSPNVRSASQGIIRRLYTLAQASTNTDLKAAHRITVSKYCLANMQKASETGDHSMRQQKDTFRHLASLLVRDTWQAFSSFCLRVVAVLPRKHHPAFNSRRSFCFRVIFVLLYVQRRLYRNAVPMLCRERWSIVVTVIIKAEAVISCQSSRHSVGSVKSTLSSLNDCGP